MEESVGFEPTEHFCSTVFKTVALIQALPTLRVTAQLRAVHCKPWITDKFGVTTYLMQYYKSIVVMSATLTTSSQTLAKQEIRGFDKRLKIDDWKLNTND